MDWKRYRFIDFCLSTLKYLGTNEDISNFNDGASYLGDIDIVKLMIKKGAKNFDTALINSSYNGDIDIIKLMIDNGAKNLNAALQIAAEKGNMNIIKMILDKAPFSYFSLSIVDAVKKGQIEVIKLITEKGKESLDYLEIIDYLLAVAIRYKQTEVYNYLKEEKDKILKLK